MSDEFIIRPTTEADLPGLVALSAERANEDGQEHTATVDAIRREWEHPDFDPARHGRVVERDGAIVGNMVVWLDRPEAWVSGYISKPARGRGLSSQLFRWGVDLAREDGAEYVITGYTAANDDARAFVTTRPGFRYERTFRRMVLREPDTIAEPAWPTGASLLDLPEDPVPLLVRLRNESFENHWNFHPWTEADVRDSFTRGERERSMCFVAAVDGVPAALCNNGIYTDPDGNTYGYLGPIGTIPAFRGTGVARALLRHSVRAHADRGAQQVSLWVDSQNQFQATGLYERHGFTTTLESVIHRLDF